jgi:membrane-bound acyltransferase YfiQ involved in biofilm formation
MAIYLVHAPIIVTVVSLLMNKAQLPILLEITIATLTTLSCSFAIAYFMSKLVIGRIIMGDLPKNV